jgi:hypothetical protein
MGRYTHILVRLARCELVSRAVIWPLWNMAWEPRGVLRLWGMNSVIQKATGVSP